MDSSAAAASAAFVGAVVRSSRPARFAALAGGLFAAGHRVVLYDGICLVCNAFINFVTDHDPEGIVHFAPLQSEFGQWLISEKGVPPMDSMLLFERGPVSSSVPAAASAGDENEDAARTALEQAQWHCRSTAALRIVCALHPRWLFAFVALLLLIPAFLRDGGYKLFAMARYRLFGTMPEEEGGAGGASCRMVTKETRARFLEYVLKDMEKEATRKAKIMQEQQDKNGSAAELATATAAAAAELAAAAATTTATTTAGESTTVGAAAALPPAAQVSPAIERETNREIAAIHGHAHTFATGVDHALATTSGKEAATAASDEPDEQARDDASTLQQRKSKKAAAAH